MRLRRFLFFATLAIVVEALAAGDVSTIAEKWAKSWDAKQLDQVMALYAPDAVFYTSTGERVTGQSAIHDLFQKVQSMNTTSLSLHSVRSGVSGDLAYDSGDYRETIITGGVKGEAQGSYLIIAKRQADGKWLIVEHMWTGIIPPTAK